MEWLVLLCVNVGICILFESSDYFSAVNDLLSIYIHSSYWPNICIVGAPLNTSIDWLQNLDNLKESMKLASSYNWSDLDFSQFQGTKKSKYVFVCLYVGVDSHKLCVGKMHCSTYSICYCKYETTCLYVSSTWVSGVSVVRIYTYWGCRVCQCVWKTRKP